MDGMKFSQPVLLPQLNLWQLPLAQESIDECTEVQIRPLTSFVENAPIKFFIPTAKDEYLFLNEIELFVKISLDIFIDNGQGRKKPLSNQDEFVQKCIPVNNFFHSLFKKVNLKLNNKEVSDDSANYAYKALFENILFATSDAKKSTGSTMYIGTSQERCDKLKKFVDAGTYTTATFVVAGPLNLDLAFQPKAIIGGTSVFIELVPNSQDYYFHLTDSSAVLTVKWDDISLYVNKYKVSKQIETAHQMAIHRSPVSYPYTRTEARTATVTAGLSAAVLDNLFIGLLPRRIFISSVKESAENNKMDQSLALLSSNVSQISVTIDGKQYPQSSYTPDFTNKYVEREYRGLLKSLNETGLNGKFSFGIDDWIAMYPIYGFNFAPDNSSGAGSGDAIGKRKYGQLSVNLRFNKPLTDATLFIIYAEFDSLLEIDEYGDVMIK